MLKKVIERVGEIARGADRWAFPAAGESGDAWLAATFAGTDVLWKRRGEGRDEEVEVEEQRENGEKGNTAGLEKEVTTLRIT